jgi:hypothetical protein
VTLATKSSELDQVSKIDWYRLARVLRDWEITPSADREKAAPAKLGGLFSISTIAFLRRRRS